MTSTPTAAHPVPDADGRRPAWVPTATVAAAAVFVVVVGLVGWRLASTGTTLHLLGGYVLRGGFGIVVTPQTVLPVLVGVAGVLWGPGAAARVRWGVLLVGSAVGAAVWAVSLAVSSGWDRLVEPLDSRYEYPFDVPRVGSIREFLSTFTASVPADSADPWTTHVAGHPPGALLAFVALDRLGLDVLTWGAVLCIVGGVLAVPAVLVTVRAVADEAAARVVAPFLVLAPIALYIATSADAFFAGVAAWGIAALAVAAVSTGWRRDLSALGGGVLLGLALFLSFGLAALGLVALTVVLLQRRAIGWGGVVRVLGIGAVGVLLVVGAFLAGGYWWLEGFHAAGDRVRSGPSYANRPLPFFLASNLAVAALAMGPAAIAGLASLRRHRLTWVVLAAGVGILASNATGLVRGETERIWLPFYVFVLAATAFLPARQRRRWLIAGVVLSLAIEVSVRGEW